MADVTVLATEKGRFKLTTQKGINTMKKVKNIASRTQELIAVFRDPNFDHIMRKKHIEEAYNLLEDIVKLTESKEKLGRTDLMRLQLYADIAMGFIHKENPAE